MNESSRDLDLPIEVIYLILKFATEQKQISQKISPRVYSTTGSTQQQQETVIIFAPSNKDHRNLLAVTKAVRSEMIRLLWRDLPVPIPWLRTERVSILLPAIAVSADDLAAYFGQDLAEQGRDWSHTVAQNLVFIASPATLALSNRFLHSFRLDTKPDGTNKILHSFRGVEITTDTRSVVPIFPVVANASEDSGATVSEVTVWGSDPLVALVVHLNPGISNFADHRET